MYMCTLHTLKILFAYDSLRCKRALTDVAASKEQPCDHLKGRKLIIIFIVIITTENFAKTVEKCTDRYSINSDPGYA